MTGLRRTGSLARRTPLKRGGPLRQAGELARDALRRSQQINPISARREDRDAVYDERRRQVFARGRGICEFYLPTGEKLGPYKCSSPMTEVHHIAGRGGRDPHRLTNLAGLCTTHHDVIHGNPAWAYQTGWLVTRHQTSRGVS